MLSPADAPGALDGPALRRKMDALNAHHADIVAGLSSEVERLQVVCHNLMLQMVLNGNSPSVPTERETTQRLYTQLLDAVRRGDVQLPDEPPWRAGAVASAASAERAEASTATDEPFREARDASTSMDDAPLAPGSPVSGSLNRSQTLPPITRKDAHSAGGAPGSSRAGHAASEAVGEVRADPSALSHSSWSSPPSSSVSHLDHGGVADALVVESASRAALGHSGGGGGGAGDAAVPRVLVRKGGVVQTRIRPRTLAPMHTTERSAMGGFGIRTNRRDHKGKQGQDPPAQWPAEADMLGL